VFSGLTKLFHVTGTAGHIQAKGLPSPAALAIAAGIVEVTCGLMVIIGWRTRTALIALILSLHVRSHSPVSRLLELGREMTNQMIHAFNNVAMIGWMFVLLGAGPGRIAVEADRS